MTIETILLLSVAAFGAGVLNAIAGGGSFLTFPALVFVGIPPIAANATSALAVSPGYLGSTYGFRHELRELDPALLRRELLIASIGGVAGALLLLVTPAQVFAGVVPWLLLFATVLFAIGPRLALLRTTRLERVRAGGNSDTDAASPAWRNPALFVACVYGGYFNGGLGILLMALYTLAGESRINTVNALKIVNSLVLSVLSVVAFAWAGAIVWREGILMMAAATVGGWAGAHLARRLPAAVVRAIVIVTGAVMTVLFFWRYWRG